MGWMAGLGLLLAAGSTASYLRLLIRRLSAMGARQLFARQSAGARRLRADRERVGVSISALPLY